MKLSRLLLFSTFAGLLSAVSAQGADQHRRHGSEKLGQVNFPVLCSTAAQRQFNRAVAMLHSFWYEEAEKTFFQTAADPKCAMGYWGIAMSYYHPVWAPANAMELQKGSAAVEKAKSVGAKTKRERDYIAAIAAFYKDSDKLDHRTRALAYEKMMERVYLHYPKDREAAVFYALSLLGTALPADKTYAHQKKAAEILHKVLLEAPEHPGVAHYLIHSFDYPQLAHLALPAARSYAKIAPSSPHALHMPSHIFTRLGLWQESIRSNLASAAAAKDWVAKTHPGAASFDQLHAMDYFTYAYLQGAQDQKAKGVVDETSAITQVEQENIAAAYALAAIPARYALERGRWSEAAALKVYPIAFPWNRFPYAEAITYFARALESARTDAAPAARQDVEKLAFLHNTWSRPKRITGRDRWRFSAKSGGRLACACGRQARGGLKAHALGR